MEQMPIVDEIVENAAESALKTLRACPVSTDDAWNCQNWVRECVEQLYESGDMLEESYNALCALRLGFSSPILPLRWRCVVPKFVVRLSSCINLASTQAVGCILVGFI